MEKSLINIKYKQLDKELQSYNKKYNARNYYVVELELFNINLKLFHIEELKREDLASLTDIQVFYLYEKAKYRWDNAENEEEEAKIENYFNTYIEEMEKRNTL